MSTPPTLVLTGHGSHGTPFTDRNAHRERDRHTNMAIALLRTLAGADVNMAKTSEQVSILLAKLAIRSDGSGAYTEEINRCDIHVDISNKQRLAVSTFMNRLQEMSCVPGNDDAPRWHVYRREHNCSVSVILTKPSRLRLIRLACHRRR